MVNWIFLSLYFLWWIYGRKEWKIKTTKKLSLFHLQRNNQVATILTLNSNHLGKMILLKCLPNLETNNCGTCGTRTTKSNFEEGGEKCVQRKTVLYPMSQLLNDHQRRNDFSYCREAQLSSVKNSRKLIFNKVFFKNCSLQVQIRRFTNQKMGPNREALILSVHWKKRLPQFAKKDRNVQTVFSGLGDGEWETSSLYFFIGISEFLLVVWNVRIRVWSSQVCSKAECRIWLPSPNCGRCNCYFYAHEICTLMDRSKLVGTKEKLSNINTLLADFDAI